MSAIDPELKKAALSLYTPPFRYDSLGGYIVDHSGLMVSDQNGEDPTNFIARVRGWGRIRYIEEHDPEKVQDTLGEMIAEALNQYWGGIKG